MPEDLHEWVSLRRPGRRAHLGLRPHVPHQLVALHLRRRAARACSPGRPRTSCRAAAATAPTSSTRRTRPPRSPTPSASPRSSGSSRRWPSARAAPPRRNKEGELKTRVVDGACIFLNRPGLPRRHRVRAAQRGAGGRGAAARLEARRVLAAAPAARGAHRRPRARDLDAARVEAPRLGRRAATEFHWWCTEGPEAFVGHEPVYETNRDEIVEMVGEVAYGMLMDHLRPRGTDPAAPPPRRAHQALRSGVLFGVVLGLVLVERPVLPGERGVLVVLLDLGIGRGRTGPARC